MPPLDAIRATPVEGLAILTAGKCDSLALRRLGTGGPRFILDEARPHFDMIVVDSAPILPVADSLLVGQQVDAVILAVLQGVSQMPHILATYQRLASLGIRILGAVVNGTTDHVYGSGYNYYNYASRGTLVETTE
jgi:Mrp family chromosome partitioning ATPase